MGFDDASMDTESDNEFGFSDSDASRTSERAPSAIEYAEVVDASVSVAEAIGFKVSEVEP